MSNDEDDTIWVDFNPNDFIIRISPILDKKDKWTGELKVGYLTLDENFLADEDYQHVDMVTNLALSSIQLMEEDTGFRDKLYEYTIKQLRGGAEPVIEKDDSNVIKLRFT